MTTWFDIEKVLDKLEELDKDTLESFARVMPPPSSNPNFNRKFDHAQERIRRRLDQIATEETKATFSNKSDDKWYKKPIGILLLSVTGGLLLLLIKFLIHL